jgi:hypothetical protein
LQRSLWHPELLVAVQVVSGPLMDGRADRQRIQVIEIDGANLSVIPIEDLIADRMAQALDGRGIRKDMQNQAVRSSSLRTDWTGTISTPVSGQRPETMPRWKHYPVG